MKMSLALAWLLISHTELRRKLAINKIDPLHKRHHIGGLKCGQSI